MKTRKHLKDCKNGDIIAEDVYALGRNIPIAVAGSAIDNKLMDRLIESRVMKILIEEADEELHGEAKSEKVLAEYKQDVAKFKRIFQDIASGSRVDLDEIAEMSSGLIESSEDIFRVVDSINSLRGLDEYTYTHSVNVALYSMMIARWIGLEDEAIQDVAKAGLLHDIGKSKTPRWILEKKGALTEAEFEKVKEHPLVGYELCGEMGEFSSEVKEAVLLHHERMDGSGYPQEVKGEDIGIYAKIVSIADIYDAITSDRPYRRKATPFRAFREIADMEYGKLDIEVRDAFLSNMPFFYNGAKVALSNGKQGEISFIYPNKIDRPIVKVEGVFLDTSMEKEIEIEAIK